MHLIVFSPWKTASTRLVESLRSSYDLVVKEILHEAYYEDQNDTQLGLSSEWRDFQKHSPGGAKYKLQRCSNSDWINALAMDLGSFCNQNGGRLCFQIAESSFVAAELFKQIQVKGDLRFELAKAEYDQDIQGLSMLHNHMEGNSYFTANALIFLVFNHLKVTEVVKSVFLLLSATGMVLLARRVVEILPIRFVIALIKYYCAAAASVDMPTISSHDLNLPSYDRELMWRRYAFELGEYFRYGSQTDLEELSFFLGQLAYLKPLVFNLGLKKSMVGWSPCGDGHRAMMNFDRCFSGNLSISVDGKLRPLNIADKSTLSTSVHRRGKLRCLLLTGGVDVRNFALMIDGYSVDVDVPSSDFSEEKIEIEVNHNCNESVYIEMNCSAWPQIEILFDDFSVLDRGCE